MRLLRSVGFWFLSAAVWAAFIVASGAIGRAVQMLWCYGYQCG